MCHAHPTTGKDTLSELATWLAHNCEVWCMRDCRLIQPSRRAFGWVSRPSLGLVKRSRHKSTGRDQIRATHIDEFLQILVQIGQIVASLFVVGNQFLFTLLQLDPLLLKRLSLGSLMIDTRHHEVVLVVISMLGMQSQEFLDRDQWELLVGMPEKDLC